MAALVEELFCNSFADVDGAGAFCEVVVVKDLLRITRCLVVDDFACVVVLVLILVVVVDGLPMILLVTLPEDDLLRDFSDGPLLV